MNIEILEIHKNRICDEWFNYLLTSYSVDARKFLSANKKSFANPIAKTFSQYLPTIFNCILNNTISAELNEALESIVRLRAVQDFKASQALDFVFALKKITSDSISGKLEKLQFYELIAEFSEIVDKVALIAFEIYARQRERLAEIKANEQKKLFATIIDKMNKKYEM